MRKMILIVFLLILPFASRAEGDERIENFEVETPRNFGYVIGDTIVHEARIFVRAPFLLVPDTVPARGKVNDWLVITEVRLKEREENGWRAYALRIHYQVFHEPDRLEVLTIPERKLGFAGGGDAFEAVIPGWSFTITPLVADDADDLAEDRPPRFVPVVWTIVRFTAFSALFALLALTLLYKKWGHAFLQFRGPFARAYRDLCRVTRGTWDEAKERAALRRLHRAFDETAGRTLVAGQLPEFFAANLWLHAEEPRILMFFEESERTFFGIRGGGALASRHSILGIARALRRAERRRGR